MNENQSVTANNNLGSWNLGKEMAGINYFDPTLEKGVLGTLGAYII
ncbi:MAG: hypothetical protein K2W95_07700 [Candidatus Obscuribacterales bacterium]|nr:hypothetical protein [Candidatus Obscuribacterales bacterium]